VHSPSADPRVCLISSAPDRDELVARIEEIAEIVEDDPDVDLVDDPPGAPPSTPSIALLAETADPERYLEQGYRGALPRTANATTLQAAIRAVMAGLVVHASRIPPASIEVPDLTPREREVLELLAQGFSNREIGETLSISSHTAKFHVQGLLDKLDATTRTEAAVRAARMWII